MEPKVPPRNKKGMRTGFTTGACAAAAAKAATRCLLQSVQLEEIRTTLPNRQQVSFRLERCEPHRDHAVCSVIKDAGDDPDCTHGAEIVAEVRIGADPGVRLHGGEGVAMVTKPGLGLEVGTAAINPVPRRNIAEMVREELGGRTDIGVDVTLHVPGGEEMAKQTTNARLGLLGGISILGTSGIVRPYSTASFKTSVVQGIDVARTRGHDDLVFTTGGRSEQFAMALLPHLPEEVFIQMGDFVGVAVKHCARKGVPRAHIVGMMGKLSKMAQGRMMTHAAGAQVDMSLLAQIAAEQGAGEALQQEILESATARRVLELCAEAGLDAVPAAICERVVAQTASHAGGDLDLIAYLVDFDGTLLGQYPAAAAAASTDPTPAEAR